MINLFTLKFIKIENKLISKKYLIYLSLICSLLFLGYSLQAQSRLYLATDDHTDYMWSATDVGYDTLFVNMLDAWIANNNASNNSPADYQTKFDCDGSYWAWVYQQNKTPAQFQTLMNQVKSGRIVIPMNPLILTYGCVPTEATIRSMYYAGELQRKYSIPFDMAIDMENQVLPLGLSSLWAGSGAKYSWHGICNCATQVPNISGPRQKEMYWYKGLDNQGVLMKWYNFGSSNSSLGGYAEARHTNQAIADLSNKVNTPSYNYNIAGAFGVGWDNLQTLSDTLSQSAQSASNSSRRVIVSNEVDFFRDFDSTYGATLPTLTQTYGNEWELSCASLSEVSASVKRSLEKLRSAEAMATIVARTNPTFASTLDSMRRQAWMSLGLYWEHDFGFVGPAASGDERTAWEIRQQQNFSSYVDQLYALASANLANQINYNSTNPRFYVFNPLGWVRTDYADYAYSGSLPVHVIDVKTNTEVPSQVINNNGTQYLRILAPNIPSVGYKVFEIRNGTGASFPNTGTVNNTNQVVDNDYFTLTFTNQGVITSLIDKTNGNKQLVNSSTDSDYINNIGLNNSYAGNNNANGSFIIDNNGPVSLGIRITSNEIIDHQTLITVFKSIPRVEIQNQETQNFGNNFLYTNFSFNNSSINSPTIWHEENGAVIHAKKVSNGGHYADQQARYDWLTLNHFAAVSSNGNYGVTLSNEDCYFMQTGNSSVTNLDENTAKLKVLVGGLVDGIGLSNQANDQVFTQHYAISTYNTYSAANSMKRSLEHQDAFTTAQVNNTSGFLPADSFSFVNISDTNTVLWALKPSEEGMNVNGAIMRVWNLSDNSVTPTISFTDDLSLVKNVTHIETDISDLSFSTNSTTVTIGNNHIQSFRIGVTPAGSGALDIAISDFSGTKQNDANALMWQVDSGNNISYFILQRSEDGNNFSSIDSVYANGNSIYNFLDSSINQLLPYYYRLEIVGISGNFNYSNVILIKANSSTTNILVYPNPVSNQLKFNLISDKQARFNVLINDVAGKLVMKLPPPLFETGNNYFTINTATLPTGMYTLTVSDGTTKYVRKFIKN